MERRLTWREFQEWQIYFDSRPPDGELFDWQLATIMAVLSGMFGRRAPGIEQWSLIERLRPKTAAEASAEVKRMFGIEA